MTLDFNLPKTSGELLFNEPLKNMVFFGVGGNADIFFQPANTDDLSSFLKELDCNIPVTVLGAGSNVLIRDGGIRGVVISLGKAFDKCYVENGVIEAGAYARATRLSTLAADNCLSGFEFLVGIPGTIGGALKMNAGCYGNSIEDIFVEAEGFSRRGENIWLTKKDLKFMYRSSSIRDDIIITRVWLRGVPDYPFKIVKRTQDVLAKRKKSQPLTEMSCGSTFKNPECTDKKAWELINEAGCRGMRFGGAMVSDIHCNFIINTGSATANDIEKLGEAVVQKVYEHSGVKLEWEVVKLGEEQK